MCVKTPESLRPCKGTIDGVMENDNHELEARRRAYYNSGAPYAMIRAGVMSIVFALIGLLQIITIILAYDLPDPDLPRNIGTIFMVVNTVFIGLVLVARVVSAFMFPFRHAQWAHLYAYDRDKMIGIGTGALGNIIVFAVALSFDRLGLMYSLSVCTWSATHIFMSFVSIYKIGSMLYLE